MNWPLLTAFALVFRHRNSPSVNTPSTSSKKLSLLLNSYVVSSRRHQRHERALDDPGTPLSQLPNRQPMPPMPDHGETDRRKHWVSRRTNAGNEEKWKCEREKAEVNNISVVYHKRVGYCSPHPIRRSRCLARPSLLFDGLGGVVLSLPQRGSDRGQVCCRLRTCAPRLRPP